MRIITSTANVATGCGGVTSAGRFGGSLAAQLQLLNQPIELNDVLARFNDVCVGPTAAYEIVLSPPRSWSILWGLAESETRDSLDRAHASATEATMKYVEQQLSFTARGPNSVAQLDATGLLWARFDHYADNLARPSRHAHVLIGTRVIGSDRQWGNIDPRQIQANEEAETFEAVFTGRLVGFSQEIVGLRFEHRQPSRPGELPRTEVVGIPDELITKFFGRIGRM